MSMPSRKLASGSDSDDAPLRVNFERVIKQGLLYKRGDLLKMFSNQYHFYLEQRDEVSGKGPYLKFGRKGKNVTNLIDLSARETGPGLNGILALKLSGTKFKVITST